MIWNMVRSKHSIQSQIHSDDYFLGKDTMEMQLNMLKPGTKVLLVDDLLATGG